MGVRTNAEVGAPEPDPTCQECRLKDRAVADANGSGAEPGGGALLIVLATWLHASRDTALFHVESGHGSRHGGESEGEDDAELHCASGVLSWRKMD